MLLFILVTMCLLATTAQHHESIVLHVLTCEKSTFWIQSVVSIEWVSFLHHCKFKNQKLEPSVCTFCNYFRASSEAVLLCTNVATVWTSAHFLFIIQESMVLLQAALLHELLCHMEKRVGIVVDLRYRSFHYKVSICLVWRVAYFFSVISPEDKFVAIR